MHRGYLPLLLFLASLWGASYMLIKIALHELEPAAMMTLRLFLAAAVLIAILLAQAGWRGALEGAREVGRRGLVLGLVNAALPFWLIAWGEKHVDSGVAAIANSTVPIFVAVLAIRLNPGERSRGLRLVGILAGLVGVGVLTGFHPGGGWWAVAGTLSVVLSSLCYAWANLFTQRHFTRTAPLVLATVAVTTAAFLILPFGLAQLPGRLPGWETLGSVALLGTAGTAVAYLVHFRLVTSYGSSRSSLVTYLLPAFALFYGSVFLGEPLTLAALLGLGLILGGVGLGSGLVRRRRVAA
ncbi:MAG: DMT family transporter [Thermoleophilia bacterium]|nr:DMT family transporter [Thermoleophilia bacterium]